MATRIKSAHLLPLAILVIVARVVSTSDVANKLPQCTCHHTDAKFDETIKAQVYNQCPKCFQFMYYFTMNRNWTARVCIRSQEVSRHSRIFVVVREHFSAAHFSLPVIFYGENNRSLTDVCYTLCLPVNYYKKRLNGFYQNIYVEISSQNDNPVEFEFRMSKLYDFIIATDQPLTVNVTSSQPHVLQYNMEENTDNVRVEATSSDSSCMVLAIRNLQCPFFDFAITTPPTYAFYKNQTLKTQSGMSITNKFFPMKSFYILLILKPTNEECMECCESDETLSKEVTVTVVPSSSGKSQLEPEYITALLGEDAILPCSFPEGTHVPYLVQWQRQDEKIPFYISSDVYPPHVGEGYEGRVSLNGLASLNLFGTRQEDQGWYECKVLNTTELTRLWDLPDSPKNGSWVHLDVVEPAVITVPPQNTSKLEGDRVEFTCEAKAMPANITHRWYHNGVDISQLTFLKNRWLIREDGLLFVSPVTVEDSGVFTCEVSNGIGNPDSGSAYLNVEYPARVTYSPTIQYLPSGLSGILRCYAKANPPVVFITWTKDRRPLEPNANLGVITLNNGSLFFQRVSHEHEGEYRCIPYNMHGTYRPSNIMKVFVRDPPVFTMKPLNTYKKPVNGKVEMPCVGSGQPKPTVTWRRADGKKLPKKRVIMRGGNLTIEWLRKEDHGRFECVLENEIATLVTSTLLLVEGTTPHALTNVTVNTTSTYATVTWIASYDGNYEQTYAIWYRLADEEEAEWHIVNVHSGNVTVTVKLHYLQPDTEYEFQVFSRNILGDGPFSPIVKARTKNLVPHVQAISGGRAILPCNITSSKEDDVFSLVLWYKGDKRVPIYVLVARRGGGLKNFKHFPNPELRSRVHFDVDLKLPGLTIDPVREADQGTYRCRVEYRRSKSSFYTHVLKVVTPPEVNILDKREQSIEGTIGPVDEESNVSLICEAEGGSPTPSVTWWRDSVLLDDSYYITTHGTVRNKITLYNVRRSDLYASFTCQAVNSNITIPASNSVILDLNLRPLDVRITNTQAYLSAGKTVNLECESTGSRPRVVMTWWKGSEKVMTDNEVISDNGNLALSTLSFVPTPEDNNKKFTCTAENPFLPDSLIEDSRVFPIHFAPVCKSQPNSVFGVDKSDVLNITCDVESDPKDVVFRWTLNNTVGSIEVTNFITDGTTSTVYYTPGVLGYGDLLCWASNNIGQMTEPCVYKVVPVG